MIGRFLLFYLKFVFRGFSRADLVVDLLVGRLRLAVGRVVPAVALPVLAAEAVAEVAVAVPDARLLGQNLGNRVGMKNNRRRFSASSQIAENSLWTDF